MFPRELADHFLLTEITPPRNNSLPASILLIIKRHHPHMMAVSQRVPEPFAAKVSKDTGVTGSPKERTGDRPMKLEIPSCTSCTGCHPLFRGKNAFAALIQVPC